MLDLFIQFSRLAYYTLHLDNILSFLLMLLCAPFYILLHINNYNNNNNYNSTQPLTPGACELSPCFLCNEEVSGPVLYAFGGRNKRKSGIINTQVMNPGQDPVFVGSKRPCSTIANLQQPARICPVTEEV